MKTSIPVLFLLCCPLIVDAGNEADAGRAAFRAIYEEMVEIDTSPTTGSCTKLVRASQARLQAAGYADAGGIFFFDAGPTGVWYGGSGADLAAPDSFG